jgi:ABC-type thiamine transport system ATPase subunit
MVSEKLRALGAEAGDDDLQRELHERAEHFAGCLTGSNRQRAANARALVRARLNRRASRAS